MQSKNKSSISFDSFRQSSVWHNQQPSLGESNNNQISFKKFASTSRQYLDESSIKRFPVGKNNSQMKKFMEQNLDVVCLLQAAEIKRLITNLQEYQLKFKQFKHLPLDRQSYEIQIRQLAEASHKLQIQNHKLSSTCQKMKEFITNQNNEMKSLSLKLNQISKQSTMKTDVLNRELTTINKKYDKSIQSLQKMFQDNENLTSQNQQLNQKLSILQDHICQIQQRKTFFENQRIQQIHRMRQSYEIKINQQNLQYKTNFDQYKTNLDQYRNNLDQQANDLNKKLQQKNSSLIQSINQLSTQLKQTQKKFINSIQDKKRLQKLLDQIDSQLKQQRQKNSLDRHTFDQRFKLFGDQIQRLNHILFEKQAQNQQIQRMVKNKTQQNQQQIIIQKTSLIEKFNIEKQNIIDQSKKIIDQLQKKHIYDIKILKQQKQQSKKQRQSLRQQRSSLKQQIQLLKHQRQSSKTQKQSLRQQRQSLKQTVNRYYNSIQQLKQDNQQLKFNIQQLHTKVTSIIDKSSKSTQIKDFIIKDYQQKIKLYFETNEVLNLKIIQIKDINQFMSKDKVEIQTKLKRLQQQKQSIQKQLQRQIVKFSQNNHKAYSILQEHTHQLDLNNLQKTYVNNHSRLLQEITLLNTKIIQKGKQKQSLLVELKNQQKLICQLQIKLDKLQQFLIEDSQNKNVKLQSLNIHVEQHLQEESNKIWNISSHNQNLLEKLSQTGAQLKDTQQIVQNAIKLAKENSQLKYCITQKQQHIIQMGLTFDILNKQMTFLKHNYEKLEQKGLSLKQLLQAKQKIIEQITQLNLVLKQQFLYYNSTNQNQDSICINQNIDRLMKQFEGINQSLQFKLVQMQRNQNTSKIYQSQSQVLSFNPSNMSFNPSNMNQMIKSGFMTKLGEINKSVHNQQSKMLDTTKIFDQNKSVQDSLNLLKRQINQYQYKIENLEQDLYSIRQKYANLESVKNQYQTKLQKIQISSQLKLNQSNSYNKICEINKKLSQQNRQMLNSNQSLIKELKQKQLTIEQISTAHQQISLQLEGLNQKYGQMIIFTQKSTKTNAQLSMVRKQLLNRQQIIQNYHQKVILMEAQHNKYKKILQSFEDQRSSLKKINYQSLLQLQKAKVTHNKIQVLSKQIQRLQHQNIDLIEELDICKFQIYEDSSQQRKNSQLILLLVLIFAEVQSLRSRVKQKDAQIDTIRKSSLNQYKRF